MKTIHIYFAICLLLLNLCIIAVVANMPIVATGAILGISYIVFDKLLLYDFI